MIRFKQDTNPVSWVRVLYLTHSAMIACFRCNFCHGFLRRNNCPGGTSTLMWQCDWSTFQEQHQHCNIGCTQNSSHRLLSLSVRHTVLLHCLHNMHHSLPLPLSFSIFLFPFDNSKRLHLETVWDCPGCRFLLYILWGIVWITIYSETHNTHTISTHPQMSLDSHGWRMLATGVQSGHYSDSAGRCAQTHTHTHAQTHTRAHTHTHTHA